MSIVPVSIVIWTVPLDLSFHLIVCRIMFFLFVFFKLLYVVFFEFWSLIRPPHPAITCSVFFFFLKLIPQMVVLITSQPRRRHISQCVRTRRFEHRPVAFTQRPQNSSMMVLREYTCL